LANWLRYMSTASSPRGQYGALIPLTNGGVELGKVLAQRIIPEIESKAEPKLEHDSSTNALIRHYRKLKETL